MINIWNLIWIIPLSMIAGVVLLIGIGYIIVKKTSKENEDLYKIEVK